MTLAPYRNITGPPTKPGCFCLLETAASLLEIVTSPLETVPGSTPAGQSRRARAVFPAATFLWGNSRGEHANCKGKISRITEKFYTKIREFPPVFPVLNN
jgi:hypothetical protein